MVTTFNEYTKNTYQRGTEKRRYQLVLSFIHPYVEKSSSTASRLIKEALELAEIYVSILSVTKLKNY